MRTSTPVYGTPPRSSSVAVASEPASPLVTTSTRRFTRGPAACAGVAPATTATRGRAASVAANPAARRQGRVSTPQRLLPDIHALLALSAVPPTAVPRSCAERAWNCHGMAERDERAPERPATVTQRCERRGQDRARFTPNVTRAVGDRVETLRTVRRRDRPRRGSGVAVEEARDRSVIEDLPDRARDHRRDREDGQL